MSTIYLVYTAILEIDYDLEKNHDLFLIYTILYLLQDVVTLSYRPLRPYIALLCVHMCVYRYMRIINIYNM